MSPWCVYSGKLIFATLDKKTKVHLREDNEIAYRTMKYGGGCLLIGWVFSVNVGICSKLLG